MTTFFYNIIVIQLIAGIELYECTGETGSGWYDCIHSEYHFGGMLIPEVEVTLRNWIPSYISDATIFQYLIFSILIYRISI